MSCWYLTNDLVFPSRVEPVAQRLGKPLRVLATVDSLAQMLADAPAESPRLVLVDLALWNPQLAELIAQLKGLPSAPTIIAYGPHVQTQALDAARSAGCDQVLARGQFDRQLESLLSLA